jgi:hypothetical protein
MDPDIERLLPWDIQKMVMGFRPAVPALDGGIAAEIRLHMARRYCHTCGEYIDFRKMTDRSFPVHVHSSSWHGYKKTYRYTSFTPSIRLHLRPLSKRHRHAIFSGLYHSVAPVPDRNIRLVVLRRQPMYFYRMDLRRKRFSIRQMVNTGMLSPFYNPEVFLPGDFRRAFHFDSPEDYSMITDARRFYPSRSVDENLCAIFSTFLRKGLSARSVVPLFLYKGCPGSLFRALLETDSVAIVKSACLLRRCPKDLLLSAILYDPSLAEHVPEEKLRRLFYSFPDVFMDLPPNPFFSLIDPLESTAALRGAS